MHRTDSVLLLVSAILALGTTPVTGLLQALAAPPAKEDAYTPLPADPYPTLQAVWRLFDIDEDGTIDDFVFELMEQEFGSPLLIRAMLDFNSDSRTSANEVLGFMRLFGGVGSMAAVDRNANGVLERPEVRGFGTPLALFAAMDVNANGVFDGEDVALLGSGGRGLPEPCHLVVTLLDQFVPMDRDADGFLSGAEAMAGLAYGAEIPFDPAWIFDTVDVDRDGLLTQDELMHAGALCTWDGVGLYHPACALSLDPFPALQVVWRLFDLDGDGGLDAAEAIPFLADYAPTAFELLDLDHNQRLTPNEVLWDGYRGRVSPLLARYDVNRNRVLEANELDLDITDPRFAFMDANGNGAFDCEDITLLSTQPGSLPASCHGVTLLLERYASTDVDRDNTLSVAEAMTGLGDALAPEVDGAAIVAYIDADNDGYLSVLELKEAGGLCLWAGPDAQLRPCKLPIDIHALLEIAWPILDRNADLHLSLAEIQQFEPAFAQWMFNLGDANRDGLVSVRELIPVLPLLPVPLFGRLEENNNRLLEYFEVQHILDFATFQAIDSNGNQLLDCGDRPAPRGLVSLWTLCPEWAVLDTDFAAYDVDRNGALSLAEVLPRDWDLRFPGVDVVGLYAMVDQDGNGGLSKDELAQVLAQTCAETEELAAPANLRLRRHAGGNNTFLSDSRLRVTLLLDKLGPGQAEAVHITETLPANWRIAAVTASAGANTLPEVQAEGSVSFAWTTPPVLPAIIVYEVDVPAAAAGDVHFFGQVTWRNAVDGPEQSAACSTTIGPGTSAADTHTVDQNQDWRISLSEILRLIQLHNAGAFHCDPNTEDHYAPGLGNHDCLPHASDYRPGNWSIDLGELLRIIQFYNMEFGAYHRSASTEDGFAAGVYTP